jgi:hypothetical protein
LHGHYHIQRLGFDRWRIEDLQRELSAIGCNIDLVSVGQGFKDMAPAVDFFERLAVEGKLRHGGHPVLAMAAANAKVELDAAGNRKISVDHIIPVKAPGGEAYPPLEGLRSLCASCHNHKTRYEQLGAEPPIRGCDIHGYPLDPLHPWNLEK